MLTFSVYKRKIIFVKSAGFSENLRDGAECILMQSDNQHHEMLLYFNKEESLSLVIHIRSKDNSPQHIAALGAWPTTKAEAVEAPNK